MITKFARVVINLERQQNYYIDLFAKKDDSEDFYSDNLRKYVRK